MFGLIGNPLGHSFSADFFNRKFEEEGIPEHYELFPLESIELLPTLLATHKELKGLNVTIPYKQQVLPFLDTVDKDAAQIGAVNVIKIYADKSMKGFNSDAIGFRNSIVPLLKPNMRKALVLGTGGASKAVCHVLRQLGIEVLSVSRQAKGQIITYEQITPDIIASHNVIVNTTPLGMWPNIDIAPDIPYHLLTPDHLCYDLVYNPAVTTFMRKAADYGAAVKNGLEMLHGQAIAAWNIWTDPDS